MSSSRAMFMRRTVLIVCLLAVIADSLVLGVTFGRIYESQRILYELPTGANVLAAYRRLFNLQRSYGQFQQDLWVALAVGRGKRNGYYVDVGSADGEENSNTYLLDQMGWKGICIDPFPRNMQRRTCQVFEQPAFGESGKKVRFRAAGDLGGIESDLGAHKTQASEAPLVEFTTATLDEFLGKGKAPHWIDYMNIDVEGAEFDVLSGLSLDRYEVGAFTIEHNYEVEKRERIHRLLEAKGYIRVRSWEVDDWYVHRDLATQYKTFLTYSSRELIF
jgi:FkbM family methyltransferase